jgi:hypothetical protein
MKRGKQSVPKADTGAIRGDGHGSQPMSYPDGQRNPDKGTSGRGGIAPKPSGGAALLGNDRPSHPVTANMARVKGRPSSPTGKMPTAASFTPVQNNAMANLTGQMTGQSEVMPRGASSQISPQTRTPMTNHPVATAKPKRRGLGAAFYGEYK